MEGRALALADTTQAPAACCLEAPFAPCTCNRKRLYREGPGQGTNAHGTRRAWGVRGDGRPSHLAFAVELGIKASTSTSPTLNAPTNCIFHSAPPQELNPNVAMVAAGLTGGVFAAACSHPFDTAKTRMQVGAGGFGGMKAMQLIAGRGRISR